MTDWLDVTERSAIAEARRRSLTLADSLGLAPSDRERAAIVATESTTNLLKHAGRGRFALVSHGDDNGSPALSIIAVDKGPGIDDFDRMSQDGQSSVGSSGTGLGAMTRQSDAFDIHTSPKGTALTARITARDRETKAPVIEIAALMDRYPGADVCGDAYAIRRVKGATLVMVCDGLGHGAGAHEAANVVTEAFMTSAASSPAQILPEMATAAVPTRGAVAMLARLPDEGSEIAVAGIGNISGLIATRGRARRLISRDGRLGGAMPRMEDQVENLAQNDTLIFHSDGLRTLRDIETRHGLLTRAPLTIAAVLLRDDPRGNDDACVMVVRRSAPVRDR